MLDALGWPVYEADIVTPEYQVETRRVDFALCHPPNKPVVFIEVKQPDTISGADRQLFEYAFHRGVPIAVLTDGQEWNFYLPTEQGDYAERRLYRLDILERDPAESAERFCRYLAYDAVRSGEALEQARQEYRSVRGRREAAQALPQAWSELLESDDDSLFDALADQTESLCGYRPDRQSVWTFLSNLGVADVQGARRPSKRRQSPNNSKPSTRPATRSPRRAGPSSGAAVATGTTVPAGTGILLHGVWTPARSGKEALVKLFQNLAERDETFLKRFAARPKHGRKRRYLADDPTSLYPGRPDLVQKAAEEVVPGWWLGTNNSGASMLKIAKMAAEVAGLTFGKDVLLKIEG